MSSSASAGLFVASVVLGCGGIVNVGDAKDAAPDNTDASPANEYTGLLDPNNWQVFDLSSSIPVWGFDLHSCFDGRYIYWEGDPFLPDGGMSQSSTLIRYDVQRRLDDSSAISSWAVNQPGLGMTPFYCDSHYVYLGVQGDTSTSRFIRYDSAKPFGDLASLSYSAPIQGGVLPALAPWPTGKVYSASFDGTFIYFCGTVRYDTRLSFQSRDAWAAFDPQLGASSPGVVSLPFLVLAPNTAGGPAGTYDTRAPFATASSWKSFPLNTLTGQQYYIGSGTDGRYAYFVPRAQQPSNGLVARYDTTSSIDAASSWRTFQTKLVHPLAQSFDHPSWDGRYFYFTVGSTDIGGEGAVVVRHDTRGDFGDPASWAAFDITPMLPPRLSGYRWSNAVFDGQFLYLTSFDAPLVVRFRARVFSRMPPGFSGTFY